LGGRQVPELAPRPGAELREAGGEVQLKSETGEGNS